MAKKAKKSMWNKLKTSSVKIHRGVFDRQYVILYLFIFGVIGTSLLLFSRAQSPDPNGSGPIKLIVVGSDKVEGNEPAYRKALVNSQTTLAFRSVLPDAYGPEIQSWNDKGYNFYYTVAASDMRRQNYVPESDVIYVPTGAPVAHVVNDMAYNKGLYMHEVVGYYAQTQHDADVAAGIRKPGDPFDWPRAVNSVDWAKIDNYVMTAQAKGKKVLWNEPDLGWAYLESNAFEGPSFPNPVINTQVRDLFKKWGNTIVPVFATNFPFKDRISSSFTGAKTFAAKAGTALGESTQSFYFRDQPSQASTGKALAECNYEPVPTEKCSYNLINFGYANKATYFGIDGWPEDTQLGTGAPYITGIQNFVAGLTNGSDPYGIKTKILPIVGAETTTPATVTSAGTTFTGTVPGVTWTGPVGVISGTSTICGGVFAANTCITYCSTFVCPADTTATSSSLVNASMYGGWSNPEPLQGLTSNKGPAATSRASGMLDVLSTKNDSSINRNIYNNGWGGWYNYGGASNYGPGVSTWGTGNINMFAVGTNNYMYQNSYDSAKSTSFTGWKSIDTTATVTSKPAAVSWGTGRIDLFSRNGSNNLVHKWYSNGAWNSGWENLGNPPVGGLTSAPTVASWGSGHLDIFVRSTDGAIWHKYFSNGWSGWYSLGGATDGVAPAAVASGYGHIFVYAVSAARIYVKAFDAATGWPTSWTYIGATTNEAPAVASWAQGRLDLFWLGTDGQTYHSFQQQTLPTYTPPPPPPVDSDGDGIVDPNDRCPSQAGPSTNGGCPVHAIPLYHSYSGYCYDNFYSTSKYEYTTFTGTCAGTYILYDCNMSVLDGQNPGTVPLWRYYNGTGYDHFYTIDRNDAGFAYYGYGFEGQVGWVYPPNSSSSLYNMDRYFAGGWIVDHVYIMAPYGSSPNWSYPNYGFERTEAQVFGPTPGC